MRVVGGVARVGGREFGARWPRQAFATPLLSPGWDYGPCEWGRGYKPDEFERAFEEMAARGATCVRLWVFGDGRAAPTFDARNRNLCTGLDPGFLEDFDNMLWRAGRHGLKARRRAGRWPARRAASRPRGRPPPPSAPPHPPLPSQIMPVLWDFIAMNTPKPADKPTRQQGTHGALFTDPELANAFCENVLRPLVTRYAGHAAIIAWDIFNEPEWCVRETGEATTTEKIPLKALQTFVGRCASIIHTDGGGTLATVGSASVKWCWEEAAGRPAWCADFWGDRPLVAANNGDPAAFLDFVQTHYYPWMKKEIDPFANPAGAYAGKRKPVIIGEAQANLLQQYSAASLLTNARSQGYAGLLYWSYKAVDDKGGWRDFARCVGGACGEEPPKSKAEGFINRIFGF